MTDEEDLEGAISGLSEAIEKNIVSKKKLTKQILQTTDHHKRNHRILRDIYGHPRTT